MIEPEDSKPAGGCRASVDKFERLLILIPGRWLTILLGMTC